MPSKFDEEMASAYQSGKDAVSSLSFNIKASAPTWLTKLINSIIYDDRTPAFLLGMGVEAAGIAIQYAIGFPAYPIIDAVTVIVLLGIIVWLQRRK
jgi:hypothetical protein